MHQVAKHGTINRMDQKGIRPGLACCLLPLFPDISGDLNDRDVAGERVLLDSAADFIAGNIGQPDVQNYKIRARSHALQGLFPGDALFNIKPRLPEVSAQ